MPSIETFNIDACVNTSDYPKTDEHQEKISAAVISSFRRLHEKLDAAPEEHLFKHEHQTSDSLAEFLNNRFPGVNFTSQSKEELINQIMEHLIVGSFTQEQRIETLHEIERIIVPTGSVRKVEATLSKLGIV